MRKTRDVLYTIFMGLILFLSGAVILGGISYFIDRYIGIDFVSVLLYFFMATFLTKRIMMNIVSRGIFYSIILPIYTGLMYLIKDYVAFLIVFIVSGASIKDTLLVIPSMMFYSFINAFLIDFSATGFFNGIINILMLVIEILIMAAGIYNSYRVTKIM